jgi:hypothetical protein
VKVLLFQVPLKNFFVQSGWELIFFWLVSYATKNRLYSDFVVGTWVMHHLLSSGSLLICQPRRHPTHSLSILSSLHLRS